MALVKKSKIATPAAQGAALSTRMIPALEAGKPIASSAKQTASVEIVAERLSAATEEIASALAESAAASTELRRSMEQIAGGAEEAAGASQEQASALKRIVTSLSTARREAEASTHRTEFLVKYLGETTAQFTGSVRTIERAAQRQSESAALTAELDSRASDIGEIARVVSGIADQTNLLALNAAIEAARAGEHGRGFAVVADEVRSLAEISDKSAREVQQLTVAIQKDVLEVGKALNTAAASSAKQASAATSVIEDLNSRVEDITQIAVGSRAILTVAIEAERAAIEVQQAAEQVAAAAEEQSSAAGEAQAAVEHQAKSLEQGHVTARGLAVLGQELQSGKSSASIADNISSSAEELSASIQKLSSTSSQIMAAVEQISRSSQLQAAATLQTSAALNQIENGAKLTQKNADLAHERVRRIDGALQEGRKAVEALLNSVDSALGETRSSLATIKRLESVGRKIDKITAAIALIAVQTGMLAVSGAVEAARAGDSGRGFAVVSNDIRTLARDSSENVENATQTVRAILEQIASLKSDLEQAILTAESEVHNNRMIFASLQKIADDVTGLSVVSNAMVVEAEDILATSGEMAQAARQIAAAAEEASMASREAATAAVQQSSGLDDLAAAVEEIASLADELKQQAA